MSLLANVLSALVRHAVGGPRRMRLRMLTARGEAQLARGNRAQALDAYAKAASLDRRDAALQHVAGALHAQEGDYAAAREHLERALILEPDEPGACTDLANVYYSLGELARAQSMYRRALAIDPDAPHAHYNLGLLLRRQGDLATALPHFERAHAGEPAHGDFLRSLVSALIELGDPQRAGEVANAATEADPSSYDAWLSLALAHQKLHRSEAALSCFERASALRQNDPELHSNRAIAFQHLGRLPEALAEYGAALELNPDYPLARFHRSLARLLAGDYAAGWPEYEARLLSKDALRTSTALPRWDGRPGHRVLVHAEQGLGDEIMFASCLPDLLQSSRGCVVTCSRKLVPLFGRSFPGAKVIAREDGDALAGAVAAVDCEIPAGSLPLHFRRALAAFPSHAGYLESDPRRVDAWRARLDALGPGMKIGLSWRGGTYKSGAPVRSLALSQLEPILRVPGTRFVNLQYHDDAKAEIDAHAAATGIEVVHWAEGIDDYDGTAALVTALDLTISVCTSVIHLGGALGRPVWVMAPYSPEWRYGCSGERMPWYPSVRIVRQAEYGDWSGVIEEIAARLRMAAGAHAAQGGSAAAGRAR